MEQEELLAQLGTISDCLYRVASKAVVIRDSKLLLVKEDEGWYGLPGGGIDYDQNPLESLQRELVEEIGIESTLDQYDQRPLFVIAGGAIRGLPRVTIYYRLTVTDVFEPQKVELAYKWVDLDELAAIELGPNIELARFQLEELLRS